jgi:hypothetical protein
MPGLNSDRRFASFRDDALDRSRPSKFAPGGFKDSHVSPKLRGSHRVPNHLIALRVKGLSTRVDPLTSVLFQEDL